MWRAFGFLLALLLLYPVASKAIWQGGDQAGFSQVQDRQSPGKISSLWGKKLNPSGAIPERGFKAIYFDRRNPGSVVFAENVESVAIKYAWSEFHNIDSPNFAAYWVGRLESARSETKQISVSQSWAKSRILIDGQIVFDGGSDRTFTHDFAPGEHIIEVEYINNWHTVEFKVTIGDAVAELTQDDLPGFLAENVDRSARLYYVGLYESSAKDTSVRVSLPRTGRPAVLWLTSYEAIDWTVSSPDPISAVVLSSHSPGSRVSGLGSGRLVSVRRWPSVYSEVKRCSCTAGRYHCEDSDDLGDVAQKLETVTNLELAGYAVRYSADFVSVQPYGKQVVGRIEAQKEANLAAQKQCAQHANPDFDTLMRD